MARAPARGMTNDGAGSNAWLGIFSKILICNMLISPIIQACCRHLGAKPQLMFMYAGKSSSQLSRYLCAFRNGLKAGLLTSNADTKWQWVWFWGFRAMPRPAWF